MNERNALLKCNHRNIVKLFSAFRDEDYFYYVLTFAPNGELLQYIKMWNGLHVECVKIFAAEVLMVMEYLHTSVGIIHRDIKPENILLDDNYHVLLIDFGTAKLLEKVDDGKVPRKGSFNGTAEYISPEMYQNEENSYAVDLWAYGCCVYQMISGRVPFKGSSPYVTMDLAVEGNITWPNLFPEDARNLIESLLKPIPTERLGYNSFDEIKQHPFFTGIDWEKINEIQPPKPHGPETPFIWEAEEEQKRFEQEKKDLREKWAKFLEEGEDILESGFIIKTVGISRKRRFLILTSTPRLIYIDSVRMIQKGFIKCSAELKVLLRNDIHFRISIPGRTYNLEDLSKNSKRWGSSITEAMKLFNQTV